MHNFKRVMWDWGIWRKKMFKIVCDYNSISYNLTIRIQNEKEKQNHCS